MNESTMNFCRIFNNIKWVWMKIEQFTFKMLANWSIYFN